MGIETLAIASLASSAGGGILSAFGASQTADANASMYNYKAQVAANNAIIARRNAASAVQSGGVQAQANDLKTRNLVGTQIVTQAANGLDVGSGSARDVQESTRDIGRLDTLTIVNNAMKQAKGFEAQAMGFEAEKGLDEASAKNAKTEGELNIAKSLLGGASSFSDKWASYSKAGAFA